MLLDSSYLKDFSLPHTNGACFGLLHYTLYFCRSDLYVYLIWGYGRFTTRVNFYLAGENYLCFLKKNLYLFFILSIFT